MRPARPTLAAATAAALAVFCCACAPKGTDPNDKGDRDASGRPSRAAHAATDSVTFAGLDVVDAQTAFACCATSTGNVVVKTTDGGATWTPVLRVASEGADLHGIDFLDASNGAAMDEDGAVYSTADGGATWNASTGALAAKYTGKPTAKDADDEPELGGVRFADAQTGWAGGGRLVVAGKNAKPEDDLLERPFILRTTDGGATWKEAQVAPNAPKAMVTGFASVDGKDVWAVGGDTDMQGDTDKGVLLHSKDGGATWQFVPTGAAQIFTDVAFADATHGWAAGETFVKGADGPSEVYATADGGATWKSVARLPGSVYAIRFADASVGWAVGSGGKIYRTTDGGVTWAEQSADVASGGVDVAKPAGSTTSEDVADAVFTDFVLVAPGRGWAVTDTGSVFEYTR